MMTFLPLIQCLNNTLLHRIDNKTVVNDKAFFIFSPPQTYFSFQFKNLFLSSSKMVKIYDCSCTKNLTWGVTDIRTNANAKTYQ